MDIDLYTNGELREMGIQPCECRCTYREYVENDVTGRDIYDVCVDCGTSVLLGQQVPSW